jgi:hypothetical protein
MNPAPKESTYEFFVASRTHEARYLGVIWNGGETFDCFWMRLFVAFRSPRFLQLATWVFHFPRVSHVALSSRLER